MAGRIPVGESDHGVYGDNSKWDLESVLDEGSLKVLEVHVHNRGVDPVMLHDF